MEAQFLTIRLQLKSSTNFIQIRIYLKALPNEQLQVEMEAIMWQRSKTRPNLKSSLSREPILNDDGTLLLRIDNHVQDDLIKSIKPQLVSWLRRELKNSSIDLVTELNEHQSQKIRIYRWGKV
jgi:hypothetical protein